MEGTVKNRKSFLFLLAFGVVAWTGAGCGYNKLQGLDEEVKAAWAEVLNQYQRRFDLVPNLVRTVQGYAEHESETLKAVVEARSRVGGIQLDERVLQDPEKFRAFQDAQAGLGTALQRLLVVAEQYPNLKANENYRDLQAQLEGTENRIAVARKRYIDAVMGYNKAVRFFPTNLTAKYILHLELRETFQPEGQPIERPPEVKF
jgi:LemA protein